MNLGDYLKVSRILTGDKSQITNILRILVAIFGYDREVEDDDLMFEAYSNLRPPMRKLTEKEMEYGKKLAEKIG